MREIRPEIAWIIRDIREHCSRWEWWDDDGVLTLGVRKLAVRAGIIQAGLPKISHEWLYSETVWQRLYVSEMWQLWKATIYARRQNHKRWRCDMQNDLTDAVIKDARNSVIES